MDNGIYMFHFFKARGLANIQLLPQVHRLRRLRCPLHLQFLRTVDMSGVLIRGLAWPINIDVTVATVFRFTCKKQSIRNKSFVLQSTVAVLLVAAWDICRPGLGVPMFAPIRCTSQKTYVPSGLKFEPTNFIPGGRSIRHQWFPASIAQVDSNHGCLAN